MSTAPPSIEVEAIPATLKELRQWVVWRYEERTNAKREKKITKVPYRPRLAGMIEAKADTRATWGSFNEALAALETKKFSGLGFVFSDDDPYCGVDLDGCIDLETGEINSEAADIVGHLNTYTELSPSGSGLHIICQADLTGLAGRHNTKTNREMYSSGRFFTMTGNVYGEPRPPAQRQSEIEAVHKIIFPDKYQAAKPREEAKPKASPFDTNLSDSALLEKMFAAKNGQAIKQLWDGDLSAYNDDPSAADLGLASYLTWWCNYDLARADTLFRQSGLMRDKWNERHSSDGRTYGQMTLDKASEGKVPGDGYSPGASTKFKRSHLADGAPDLLEFLRTDYGNAERLHALFGHEFKYCSALGYLVWDGMRWRVDEDESAMRRLALETARELFAQAGIVKDSDQREVWVRHSLSCERSAALKNAVDLTKTIPGVTIDVQQLDRNPMLLNVSNGTIDLNTGLLKDHDPADLITKLATVEFDLMAECPRWLEFQRTICASDDDLILFKQRAYGYSATGKTSEDALFIPYGTGANGKSTELDAIGGILGDYANTAQFETFAVKKNESVRNDIADLMGARFVSASEGENRQRLAEGLVKQMTGGDVMKARFLHKEYFRFKPAFKLWLATNHKPVIRGTDHGIWRRIRLIPYAVTIPQEQRDKKLKEKLEAEKSGILNWILEGCRLWLEQGLGEAEAVRTATESYRRESDVLAEFITARCVVGELHSEIAGDLYKAYERWCEESGEEPFTSNLFGRMLTERGYTAGQARIEGKMSKTRAGICLQENAQREGVKPN
jgi:putative DNA primase/helicase